MSIEKEMDVELESERGKMEQRIGFIEKIGQEENFIGMLGKVVGIMKQLKEIED